MRRLQLAGSHLWKRPAILPQTLGSDVDCQVKKKNQVSQAPAWNSRDFSLTGRNQHNEHERPQLKQMFRAGTWRLKSSLIIVLRKSLPIRLQAPFQPRHKHTPQKEGERTAAGRAVIWCVLS